MRCSTAWRPPGRGRPHRLSRTFLTRRRYPPPGRRKDRQEPDGSRQTGLEAPPLVNGGGVPLAVRHTAADVHDPGMLEEAVNAVRPISLRAAGQARQAKETPGEAARLLKVYDFFPRCRKALCRRGIKSRIARRGIDSSERLGRQR